MALIQKALHIALPENPKATDNVVSIASNNNYDTVVIINLVCLLSRCFGVKSALCGQALFFRKSNLLG